MCHREAKQRLSKREICSSLCWKLKHPPFNSWFVSLSAVGGFFSWFSINLTMVFFCEYYDFRPFNRLLTLIQTAECERKDLIEINLFTVTDGSPISRTGAWPGPRFSSWSTVSQYSGTSMFPLSWHHVRFGFVLRPFLQSHLYLRRHQYSHLLCALFRVENLQED